ncbi:ferredoxin reductase [Actinomadura sp. DC4]|uniref:ferredoxin reductase n=1 Tax=Actinomadura sp. DC4 TaxID=3055069 RepID=UPI0025B126E8|nr:ferredoxin reductase [Actinomadura sp. DC4]MDN3353824.1 ferredoxin reductase [Actinomadura sp. DC4]
MARTAISRRLTWRVARLAETREETATARTLVFDVPGWPGHLAGQHVDVRLTAEDGYSTQRSYSLAAPADGDRVELTVQNVRDGEVSPYLTEILRTGDPVEFRGPVGGWFVWRPAETAPVLLVAGGSGIVPLMAMIRARRQARARTPFRLVYSVRTPADRYYAEELRRSQPGLDVAYVYTREAPGGSARAPGRLTIVDLDANGWPAGFAPDCFVCGPTGFVERAAGILLNLGHAADKIKTERFGPSGG